MVGTADLLGLVADLAGDPAEPADKAADLDLVGRAEEPGDPPGNLADRTAYLADRTEYLAE